MPATRSYSFGEYTLDLRRGALLRAGADVKLRPKSFEVLRLLIARHGQLVSREELLDAVWGDVVVTDGVLGQSLIEVRRALGDASQQIVRTVPRRGYIFDSPVVEEDGAPAERSDEAAAPAGESHEPPPDSAGQATANVPRRIAPAVVLGAVLLVVAGAGAILWWLAATTERSAPVTESDHVSAAARNSIAVLPFVDLSPEQDQEYFAEGMSEEILNLLAQAPELQVIARTSSFSFKGRNADIAEIATKLNVAHVLEGSVRKDGSRLRITAQLIDARDSSHLWSQTYDRESQDAFSVQRDIATRVSEALKVTLADHGDASAKLSPNAQAHESYLRGRFFFNRRGPGDMERAREEYEQALRLDPKYARAWEGLAGVYGAQVAEGGLSRERGMALRWPALQKALKYDPNLPEAHIRAAWHFYGIGEIRRGDEHANRAYQLDRDNPQVLGHFADRLAWHDRMDEALTMMQRAVMLDPVSPTRRGNYAGYLESAGRYAESRAQRLQELELNPAAKPAIDRDLACLLILERRFVEARAALTGLAESDEREQMSAMVEYALGNRAPAEATVAKLEARSDPKAAVMLAEIHAQREDAEQTFRWMAVAHERLGPEVWSSANWQEGWKLRFSPFLRLLHDDPRWASASRVTEYDVGG